MIVVSVQGDRQNAVNLRLQIHKARLFDVILTAKGIAGAGRGIPGAWDGAF